MPDTTQAPQQQTDLYAEFGGSATAAPPTSSSTAAADPYAEFGGSAASAPSNKTAPPAMTAEQIAQRSEAFKNKAWSDIASNVKQGNLHGAASSFLSLFHNPDEDNPADLLVGAGKGAAQTVNTVSSGLSKIVPSVVRPQDVQALSQMETPSNTAQKAGTIAEQISEFFMGDEALKGLSIAERAGMLAKVAKVAEAHPVVAAIIKKGFQAVRQGTVTAGQQLLHGASPEEAAETGATAAGLGTVVGAAAEGGNAITHVFLPGEAGEPGVLKQVWQGEKVAQPVAQDALRAAAKVGGAQEGLSTVQPSSLRTVLHEPIDAIESKAKNAYRQIDAASGTDFRALNDKLANTNYELRNLTETEEDVAREAKLEKSRTAILDKIEAAKQGAIDSGVDPKQLEMADAQFKQAQAMRDVEAKVFKNPNIVKGNSAMGTPETIDIDGAVKALQKLQDSEKYGAPRLEQAFGKDGANNLLKDLYASQRSGQKAIAKQDFIKTLANYAKIGGGLTALGGGAYELLK